MPRAPKLCSYRDCIQVAGSDGRCDQHPLPINQDRRLRSRFDNRGSSSQRGYGAEWRKIRKQVLIEEPVCRRCPSPSSRVDHIIPKAQGGTDERSNLQGLCQPCHDRKTIAEDGGLVFGRRIRRRA